MLKSRLILCLLSAAVLVAACAPGDDAAVRQAKQECRDRGLDAATAAFGSCVEQVADRIYISWGRDRQSLGD